MNAIVLVEVALLLITDVKNVFLDLNASIFVTFQVTNVASLLLGPREPHISFSKIIMCILFAVAVGESSPKKSCQEEARGVKDWAKEAPNVTGKYCVTTSKVSLNLQFVV